MGDRGQFAVLQRGVSHADGFHIHVRRDFKVFDISCDHIRGNRKGIGILKNPGVIPALYGHFGYLVSIFDSLFRRENGHLAVRIGIPVLLAELIVVSVNRPIGRFAQLDVLF